MNKKRVKTFDEVLKKAKKESYKKLKDRVDSLDGIEKIRVDSIIEMRKFDDGFKNTKKSKEVLKIYDEDALIYRCDKPTIIEENARKKEITDENEKVYESIKIEASDVVIVESKFNIKDNMIKSLELINVEDKPYYGRIIFKEDQTTENLTIKNVAVRGKFNSSKVSIDGVTYLDIYLDAKDNADETELIIRPNDDESRKHSFFLDEEGKNIRGKINLSVRFYNKLSIENKRNLRDKNFAAHIFIENVPLYIYGLKKIKGLSIEEIRKQFMILNKNIAINLNDEVDYYE